MAPFPAHSWSEWMVGQNYRSSIACKPPQVKKPLLRVDISEPETGSSGGESSGDEVVQITTYPGRRRRNSVVSIVRNKSAPGPSCSNKTVQISGGRKRKHIKSALKKFSSSGSSSSTLINASDESDTSDIDTSEVDSSEVDSSEIDTSDIDTSDDDAPVRTKRSKSKTRKVRACKKISIGPVASDDALPHPTCQCKECIQGRKVLRAVIEFEAKTKAAESETKGKGKGKQKGKVVVSYTEDETSNVDTSGDEIKPPFKGKNKKQQQKKKQPKVTNPAPKATPMSTPKVVNKPSSPQKVADKAMYKLPALPEGTKPNLIMSPAAKVLQVEHAMEGPYDPKPNAFYDNGRGIARVYHGPRYGNHDGSLYGDYAKANSTPRMPAAGPPGYDYYLYGPHPPPGTTPYALSRFYGAHGPNHLHPGGPQAWGQAPADGAIHGYPPPTRPANYDHKPYHDAQQSSWTGNGPKGWPKKPASDTGCGWKSSPPKDSAWGAAPESSWPAPDNGSDKGSKKGNGGWNSSPPKDTVWGAQPETSWPARGDSSDKGSKKGNGGWNSSPPKHSAWGAQPENTWPAPGKSPSPITEPAPKAPSPVPSPIPSKPDSTADLSKDQNGWGGGDAASKGEASPAKFGGWGEPSAVGFQRRPKRTKESRSRNRGNQNGGNDWGATQSNQNWGDNNGNGGGDAWQNNSKSGSKDGNADWSRNCNTWNANDNNGNSGWNAGPGSKQGNNSGSKHGDAWASNGGNGGWNNGGTHNSPASAVSKPRSPLVPTSPDKSWGPPPGAFPSNGGWNNNGKSYHPGPNNRFQGEFPWSGESGPPSDVYHRNRRHRTCGGRNEDYNRVDSRHRRFNGSQPGGPRSPHVHFDEIYYHTRMSHGPDDWTNKPSDQATGPSNTPEWQNANAAQDTQGAASRW